MVTNIINIFCFWGMVHLKFGAACGAGSCQMHQKLISPMMIVMYNSSQGNFSDNGNLNSKNTTIGLLDLEGLISAICIKIIPNIIMHHILSHPTSSCLTPYHSLYHHPTHLIIPSIIMLYIFSFPTSSCHTSYLLLHHQSSHFIIQSKLLLKLELPIVVSMFFLQCFAKKKYNSFWRDIWRYIRSF